MGHARPSAVRGDPAAHLRTRRWTSSSKGALLLLARSTSARRASTSTGRASWMGSGTSSTSGCSPWRSPTDGEPRLARAGLLGNFTPAEPPDRDARGRATSRGDGLAARTRAAAVPRRDPHGAARRGRPGRRPRRAVADRAAPARRTRRSAARPPTSSRSCPAPKAGSRRPRRATRSCWPAATAAGRTSSASGRSRSRRSSGSPASSSCRIPSARRPRSGGSSRTSRPKPPPCAWSWSTSRRRAGRSTTCPRRTWATTSPASTSPPANCA